MERESQTEDNKYLVSISMQFESSGVFERLVASVAGERVEVEQGGVVDVLQRRQH
jgi:hypothetical protein